MVGKKYKHRNANIYTVLYLTNTFGGKGGPMERLKDHPIDVVYQGDNGYVWSRRLSDWNRSFTEVLSEEEKGAQLKSLLNAKIALESSVEVLSTILESYSN